MTSNDASRVDPALAVDKARSADFPVHPPAVSSCTDSTCRARVATLEARLRDAERRETILRTVVQEDLDRLRAQVDRPSPSLKPIMERALNPMILRLSRALRASEARP
jgi:hypothetical protein